jgi:hypothetical protein
MKTLQFIEREDIINPTHLIRPLYKSADFSTYSDQWNETSCYSGSPEDHLKWCPVYLKFWECWWGKTWKEYYAKMEKAAIESGQNYNRYEVVCGELPKEHLLSLTPFKHRYPLYFEQYKKFKKEFESRVFKVGQYKDRKYGDLKYGICCDSDRRQREYLIWYCTTVSNEEEDVKEYYEGGVKSQIYYSKKFKKWL